MLRPFGRARIAIQPVTFSGRWHYVASSLLKRVYFLIREVVLLECQRLLYIGVAMPTDRLLRSMVLVG